MFPDKKFWWFSQVCRKNTIGQEILLHYFASVINGLWFQVHLLSAISLVIVAFIKKLYRKASKFWQKFTYTNLNQPNSWGIKLVYVIIGKMIQIVHFSILAFGYFQYQTYIEIKSLRLGVFFDQSQAKTFSSVSNKAPHPPTTTTYCIEIAFCNCLDYDALATSCNTSRSNLNGNKRVMSLKQLTSKTSIY